MKSFSGFDFATKKKVLDTKIPSGEIPFILLHWLDVYYYGGGLSPLDIRKFLESKMRESFYEKDIVDTWVRQAHGWKQTMDHAHPGLCNQMLADYLQISVVV